MRSAPLDAALGSATRGWAVFPLHSILARRCSCWRPGCSHPAKHPLTRHGRHDASMDHDAIRAWWDRRSWANIGVATGARSGLVVIDVDPSVGHQSLDRLQSLMGSLPPTLTACTVGGVNGRHANGGSYTWEDEHADVAPAPAWLRSDMKAHFPTGAWTRPLPHRGGSRYGLAAFPPRGRQRTRRNSRPAATTT